MTINHHLVMVVILVLKFSCLDDLQDIKALCLMLREMINDFNNFVINYEN